MRDPRSLETILATIRRIGGHPINTFGDASKQFALCDPRSVVENRSRFRREMLPLMSRVNSFYCPAGRFSFKGWLLLPRYEYDQLDKMATNLRLNIGDTTKPDNVSTLKNLCIVQAQCVTRGIDADPNAMYLIEVTDARGILHNQWFQFPTNSQYNVRAPAYPGVYYSLSTNVGSDWTWSTMLQNLWQQMTLLGTWPGLPTTPTGTPEGYWFPGIPAWYALCDVLEHLGMIVACDLTQNSPYTIVQKGTADTALSTAQTRFSANLEDDLEWIDLGAGRVPASVTVLFRRRNSIYGTEETVRYDSYQWVTSAVYPITVAAPAAYSTASGKHHLWSDFTIRYDEDNNPVAADVITAGTIASQRASQYYASIDPDEFMSQTYAGALPFATGSMVDGVCWSQRYRDDDHGGWRTHVVHGPNPPWPDIWK